MLRLWKELTSWCCVLSWLMLQACELFSRLSSVVTLLDLHNVDSWYSDAMWCLCCFNSHKVYFTIQLKWSIDLCIHLYLCALLNGNENTEWLTIWLTTAFFYYNAMVDRVLSSNNYCASSPTFRKTRPKSNESLRNVYFDSAAAVLFYL
jgi:hypothetical protein